MTHPSAWYSNGTHIILRHIPYYDYQVCPCEEDYLALNGDAFQWCHDHLIWNDGRASTENTPDENHCLGRCVSYVDKCWDLSLPILSEP